MRTEALFLALALALCTAPAMAGDTTVAPPSPDRPWPIPRVSPLPGESPALAPDATHAYDLPELIDFAQRLDPETRGAWEQARAAAINIGLVTSSFLPTLSIEAIGGYQRTPLPIPSNLVPAGYFTSDTRELIPSLTAKWLLFDFGRRDAVVEQANAKAFIANVAFTGAHQQLVYTVSHDYFAYSAAQGRLKAAEHGVETARIDCDAVTSRNRNGVATVVEVARANRQLAQAQFALVRAQGQLDVAQATLVADIGFAPGTSLHIADTSSVALPLPPPETVAFYVDQAINQRPDVVAALSKVRVADAAIDAAHADRRPTIALLGQLYQNEGSVRTSDGGDWYSVHKPGGAIFLQFSWPIFDGGERSAKLGIAQVERESAVDAYHHARDVAGKEVSEAFTGLRTALAAVEAAAEVTRTAHIAHDAALSAFRHGTATYDDLATEADAVIRAETDEEDARANAFTAAATLAFATGNPGSASRSPSTDTPHR